MFVCVCFINISLYTLKNKLTCTFLRCIYLHLLHLFQISNDFHTSIQQPASDSEDSSALLDNLHMRLSAKSKELHETLKVEQDSLVKTKAFLKEQQETLKQRKRALKLARKDWTKSNKMETTILVSMFM